jgi:predicted nucleotidyltransferase
LNANRVKYLVIGGIACAIYGSPRATLDLDIVIEPTIENARALLKALKEAGFGTAFLTTAEKIASTELNILNDYIKMDILTKAKGVDFDKCWKRREVKTIEGVRVNLISLADLTAVKKAVNRPIDRYDIKILKKIAKRLSSGR